MSQTQKPLETCNTQQPSIKENIINLQSLLIFACLQVLVQALRIQQPKSRFLASPECGGE